MATGHLKQWNTEESEWLHNFSLAATHFHAYILYKCHIGYMSLTIDYKISVCDKGTYGLARIFLKDLGTVKLN